MTAQQIQRQLLIGRYRESFALPNYTPKGWFECDVFQLTKAGYFVEYEVKISRSDFQADASKVKKDYKWDDLTNKFERTGQSKHQMLVDSCPAGPTRFYYVCPTGLIDPKEIPAWAGLIEIRRFESYLLEREIVPAPKLHQKKPLPEIEHHARSVIYWRFNSLFCKVHKLPSKSEPEQL